MRGFVPVILRTQPDLIDPVINELGLFPAAADEEDVASHGDLEVQDAMFSLEDDIENQDESMLGFVPVIPRTQPDLIDPVIATERILRSKKTDWPKLDRFKFLILDILSARRVSAELQLESQSKPMG
jgi:hypothetical protein